MYHPFLGSGPVQATLRMSYEYLRLYTNAFAFRAADLQLCAAKRSGNRASESSPPGQFPLLASMEDARFIYESVDAAMAYLTILVESVDPRNHLRFMPIRFY